MTPPLPRSGVRALLLTLAIGMVILAGCSGSGASDSAATASPDTSAAADPSKALSFEAALSSDFSKLFKVGEADSQVFGLNVLKGTTTINDAPVQVEVLGTVDYENGSGPFGSFLVLTWDDGSVLGSQLDGKAAMELDSQATSFEAALRVINGSGRAEGVSGEGKFTGSRSGPLATEIEIQVELNLADAPETLTGN